MRWRIGRDGGLQYADDGERWVTIGPEGNKYRVQIDGDGNVVKGRGAGSHVSSIGDSLGGGGDKKKGGGDSPAGASESSPPSLAATFRTAKDQDLRDMVENPDLFEPSVVSAARSEIERRKDGGKAESVLSQAVLAEKLAETFKTSKDADLRDILDDTDRFSPEIVEAARVEVRRRGWEAAAPAAAADEPEAYTGTREERTDRLQKGREKFLRSPEGIRQELADARAAYDRAVGASAKRKAVARLTRAENMAKGAGVKGGEDDER